MFNDRVIVVMKRKAAELRKNPTDPNQWVYTGHVYLRVLHHLGLTELPQFPNLSEWGMTRKITYDQIWREFDIDDQLDNDLRRIICDYMFGMRH